MIKLKPGTRVAKVLGGQWLTGVVMPYDKGVASTAVPIRFSDGVWRQFRHDEVDVEVTP
jgi:hypothetical protein